MGKHLIHFHDFYFSSSTVLSFLFYPFTRRYTAGHDKEKLRKKNSPALGYITEWISKQFSTMRHA